MVPRTRAKFKCAHVADLGDGKEITLEAVTDGSEENESFFKYTPSGQIKLAVVNPDVVFEEGKEYYVDFTPAA